MTAEFEPLPFQVSIISQHMGIPLPEVSVAGNAVTAHGLVIRRFVYRRDNRRLLATTRHRWRVRGQLYPIWKRMNPLEGIITVKGTES